MTDKIESKGKTVEDAVNEALLQMGARRDEVNIEILDEPKAGLFGILGGKRARVLVTRKAGGARSPRGGRGGRRDQPLDAVAYDLNDKEGSRRRGGRGRSGQAGARREEEPGARGQQDGRSRREPREPREARETREPREAREPREGRDSRDSRGTREPREPREPRVAREGGEGRPAREGEGSGRSRRRGGRGRRGGARRNDEDRAARTGNGAVVERVEGSEPTPGNERRPSERSSERPSERLSERGSGERQGGERSGGLRRGGRSRRNRDSDRPQERPLDRAEAFPATDLPLDDLGAAPVMEGESSSGAMPEPRPRDDGRRDEARREDGRRDGRGRSRGRGRDGRDGREGRTRDADADTPETYVPADHDSSNDRIIRGDISAAGYADPVREVADEDVDQTLINFTSGMLLRAGFPVRCEVKDGEYRQVRIVTDDTSAGVLIGRHGATVDAVEHLVDRMIGMAAGDRVRMNLDINNYRRRREESLHDRVLDAASMVRENGRTFHMEAMCARERRIVHLEVEKMAGLRTYTMGGAASRHVVIALDNGEADELEPGVGPDAADELDGEDEFNVAEADSAAGDLDEFDDGPQPETNELVVDDDDDLRPLI